MKIKKLTIDTTISQTLGYQQLKIPVDATNKHAHRILQQVYDIPSLRRDAREGFALAPKWANAKWCVLVLENSPQDYDLCFATKAEWDNWQETGEEPKLAKP